MLIAELGCNHFGSMAKAKEMIRVARESGADVVKLQAFEAGDVAWWGSMPPNFYQEVAFSLNQHVELIDYGKSIGAEIAYSVFTGGALELNIRNRTRISKYSARQARFAPINRRGVIVSVSETDSSPPPGLAHPAICQVMLATRYQDHDGREDYDFLRSAIWKHEALEMMLRRPVGWSDHLRKITMTLSAIAASSPPVVEKHFVLEEDRGRQWAGVTFRDTVHAAGPKDFERLAAAMASNHRNLKLKEMIG